jgi:hypothetical protein
MPPQRRDPPDAFAVDEDGPAAASPRQHYEDDETTPLRDDETCPELLTAVPARKLFLLEFSKTNGPPQILVLMVILAFGFGSTVGVVRKRQDDDCGSWRQPEVSWLTTLLLLFIAQVPAVMMDRFARINHGFNDSRSCGSFAFDKPKECLAGSADSQSAAAWEQLISNLLCFFLNTLVGSISDQYGRKSKLPYIVMYRLMQ